MSDREADLARLIDWLTQKRHSFAIGAALPTLVLLAILAPHAPKEGGVLAMTSFAMWLSVEITSALVLRSWRGRARRLAHATSLPAATLIRRR